MNPEENNPDAQAEQPKNLEQNATPSTEEVPNPSQETAEPVQTIKPEEVPQDGADQPVVVSTPEANTEEAPKEAATEPVSIEVTEVKPDETAQAAPVAAPEVQAAPQPESSETSSEMPTPSTHPEVSQTTVEPPTETANQADNPTVKPLGKRLLFLLIPALIILTLIGILIGMQVFSSGQKLQTYSNDTFSIKYPDGYEQQIEGSATAFKEAGDANDETLSGVIVAMDDLPADITDAQRNLIKEKVPEQVDAFLTATTVGGSEIRNQTSENTTIVGSDARRVTADIFKDDQKVGTFYINAGLTEKKLVLLAVLVHDSDPALHESAPQILSSFDLKQ